VWTDLLSWLWGAGAFVWHDLLTIAFLLAMARQATPLLFAASGGVVSERSGIVNIALEGLLLGGAFAAISAAARFDSALAGILVAIAAGVGLASLHALVTIRWKVDQIVSGVALNLLVTGLSKLLLDIQFGSAANSPTIAAASLPKVGGLDPLILLGLALPFLVHALLERTRFGLRLRAVGEHPEAARSLGIRVGATRAVAVLISGALASLGGVYLAFDSHRFVADMSNGRGFMALAAVIFGGWRPRRALLACLLFGGLEALQDRLQGLEGARSFLQLIQILPYVATLVVLATTVKRARAPAALGKPS
jgi:simple sugar transport system permease protein